MTTILEKKFLSNGIVKVKQIDRNGVPVGIVEGYIATWDLDRGDWFGTKDQFTRGAFKASLKDLRKRNRPIRLKDHHDRTIGGFPIDKVKEDERGLFGVGEINLEVQQGREAFALAKQQILTDFSIGFSIEESSLDEQNNIRTITKATVWEGSIVDEPMNPEANITDVKNKAVVPFKDLPLADRDKPWDSTAAIKRLREFTDSTDEPGTKYKNGFVWYDKEDKEDFGAYKLPIADVVSGKLVAVPRAIFAAAAALQGARGGVDLPSGDKSKVIRHIEKYYAKMDMDSPFSDDEKQFFVTDDIEAITKRQLEDILYKTGSFSRGASKLLASKTDCTESKDADNTDDLEANDNDEAWEKVLKGIENIAETLQKSRT